MSEGQTPLHLFVMERRTGRLTQSFTLPNAAAEVIDEPDSIDAMRAVAGGIVLSNDEQTLLLPGSNQPQ